MRQPEAVQKQLREGLAHIGKHRGAFRGTGHKHRVKAQAAAEPESEESQAVALAKARIAKRNQNIRDKVRAEVYRKTIEDPARWVCLKCTMPTTGDDTLNHSERDKCWQCSRARPGDNAEKMAPKVAPERWMCDCTLASELHTTGSQSRCRDCGKKRVIDSDDLAADTMPHRTWLVQRRSSGVTLRQDDDNLEPQPGGPHPPATLPPHMTGDGPPLPTMHEMLLEMSGALEARQSTGPQQPDHPPPCVGTPVPKSSLRTPSKTSSSSARSEPEPPLKRRRGHRGRAGKPKKNAEDETEDRTESAGWQRLQAGPLLLVLGHTVRRWRISACCAF